MKSIDFFGRLDPLYSIIENQQDESDLIDLFENGYIFAIQQIDERFGRIKVEKAAFIQEDGEEYRQEFTEIEMVRCNTLSEYVDISKF